MALEKIEVALVGHGHIGQWHAQKIHEHPLANLTSIVETNRDALGDIEKKYPGVWVTPNLVEAQERAQAFVVATPTSTHFDIVAQLMEGQKHILCEKPLTSDYGQACQIMEERQKKDIVIQVGHSERFHEVWERRGQYAPFLKGPCFIRANRLGVFKGRATDVDVVCDLMVHDLDIIYYLLGEIPQSVYAVGHKAKTSKWDHVLVRMEFASGTCAFLTAGRNYIEEVRNFEAVNQEGCFFVDLYKHKIKVLDNKALNNKVSISPYEKRDHLFLEQDHFYRSILEKSKEIVDCHDGVLMVKIVDGILRSLEEGKVVFIND